MSGAPLIPSRAVRRTTAAVLQPSALFSWHARFASLDALTGQVGTFTRASTSTAFDSNDAGFYVGYGFPRWYSYSAWAPSPDPRVTGIELPFPDTIVWPVNFAPQSLTVLLEGITPPTPVNGGRLLSLGNDAGTVFELAILGTATSYQVFLNTGSGTLTSTLSTAVTNARVRMLVQMEDNGATQRVRIGVSLSEAAFSWAGWSAVQSRAADFPSSCKARLCYGTSAWVRRLSIYPGLLTLDEATARL